MDENFKDMNVGGILDCKSHIAKLGGRLKTAIDYEGDIIHEITIPGSR